MNDFEYDELLETLGKMRERLRNLEENDYIAAYYKGYSTDGSTTDGEKEEVNRLSKDIEAIERQLDGVEW